MLAPSAPRTTVRARSVAAALLLAAPLAAALLVAAPLPASGPLDPDLRLGRTCLLHPRADKVLAALPDRVDETVVLWPRVGTTRAWGGCATVARVTLVDHHGLLVTASFVFGRVGIRPEPAFVPWDAPPPEEGEAPPPPRTGPPRSERIAWLDDGRPDAFLVLSGSPTASEESLEGLAGFLDASEAATALLALF